MKLKRKPIKGIEMKIDEKRNWFFMFVTIVSASAFTTALVQYLLLTEDLRGKISNRIFFLNICCALVIYLFVLICSNHLGITCIIAHTAIFLFALANYFVYEFRGNELVFSDIRTVVTGLSVAAGYRFSLNAQAVNAVLLTVLFILGAWKLKIRCKKAAAMRILCISMIVLLSVVVAERTKERTTETWEQKGTYHNGYLLNFVLSIRDSFVAKPEGYSKELIVHIEEVYQKKQQEDSKEKPIIVTIMNESFADLRVLGNLETNQQVMPFVDSLSENTIKGYALASVFGSKTPNSEWEFLTGNSMAFLPSGAVPYQQYIKKKNAYSIVDALKQQDYTCVAMHPYYETGWSRNTVYPKIGFDEMYFLEEFDQSNPMRQYVSDAAMYEKIIERFEAKEEGEALFLFGITMQNHGGYKEYDPDFSEDVYGTNIFYPDVNQYLSLVHQSDLAVEKLIHYFSKVKEHVIVCFFGDHQPSLNLEFYYKLNGKGQSGLTLSELEEFFMVPFFIWTNYESESETVKHTSLNFLSTMLLKRAGIALPPYHQFLSDLMEVVPAMNERAYYSKERNQYLHYEEGSKKDKIWILRYQNLQYNGLFDDKNRSQMFFGR